MKQSNVFSLKTKALLLGILPAVAMSLLIGGYLINARLDDIHRALQSRGQALANELAATSVYGLFIDDQSSLEASARKFLSDPDIASISIRSSDGSVLMRLENPDPKTKEFTAGTHKLYRFRADVAGIQTQSPIDAQDSAEPSGPSSPEPLGSVELTLLNRSVSGLKWEVLSTALLLIIAGILIISLLALAMSRRVIRPIISLSEAIDRLKQGDLSTRVERHSRDEIGVLEAGFNEMAARIAVTQDELMEEVNQAVQDLQTTMDALEVRNIELDLARKRALKASQAKSDFLALISHEIRTPMNGIVGFAHLLGKSKLDDRQAAQLEAIQDSAENLLAVINDVLDFSKLESGSISFHPEPFQVRQLASSVMSLFANQAAEKGLELQHMVYDDVPNAIEGDSLRIRQVLINLLGNAVKFTPKGRIILRIMLDGTDENELITFSVQDTGIGISPESADKLFQPFTQADGSTDREYGGTGLGLSISRKLVEGMQGEIDFDSTPGNGTTFCFRLPLVRVDNTPEPLSSSPGELSASHGADHRLDGLQILVADDNPINLKLAQTILCMHGAQATTATTGQEVLEQTDTHTFDLILMDVHMPVMNGLEAARRVRDDGGPNADTPIIAITADVMAENQQQVFHAGMNDILLKPLNEEGLIETIGNFVTLPETAMEKPGQPEPSPPPAHQESVSLPLRDREAALKTAAGNQEVADKLFDMLLSSLDDELTEIRRLGESKAWDPLWDRVHKLLGASAACGVPALHASLQQLETAVTENHSENLHQLIGNLGLQVEKLKKFAIR